MSVLLSATSYFSLMRGVLSPHEICRRAAELGYSAVALTDRNNLYGLPEFLQACTASGLRPIIGAEIVHNTESALIYADGKAGFGNLCRIITARQCNREFDIAGSISTNPEGLHIVTGSVELLKSLEGHAHIYYRISNLRRPPEYVRDRGVPCLIVPCAAFVTGREFQLHKLLRAIDINTALCRVPPDDLLPESAIISSWEETQEHFAVFDRAVAEAEKFGPGINSSADFSRTVMPGFLSEESSSKVLRRKCFEGAQRRYHPVTEAVEKRLNYEFGLIEEKGFASYFLIVDDIVKQSPRTCGRGSGAASCVAYCLGITNVDPIRYNLMFERFLNPGRKDPPDIDIDFAWDERDSVLDYVFEKYGTGHAAMVANHLTFQPRMAMREVARVYGYTESEISEITKKFPYFYAMGRKGVDIHEVISNHPRTKDMPLDPPWPEIITLAQKLIGIPRGIGTHCGGVVITPGSLCNHAPVQHSAKGYQIIQWGKDGTEDMGLVKIDLLGNRSLAVIRDAVAHIKKEGIGFNEAEWEPAQDRKTVELLAEGKTIGVFYVESPAMRLLQKKTGYGDFEHLVIHSSIIRPAANKYISKYIKRLHGASYTLDHPILGEVLAETFGIMVYQEDVAKVAMALAGFSAEDADGLRKIMSKKNKREKLNDYREQFFTGALQKGVESEAIERIWQMCLSFTGYSFCKPHSASYVQVSFQSAWLKAHYPAAFMAAVISNYGGFYTTQAYISEAQRLGIMILPPCVNNSERGFVSRGMTIRVGLCQIKGLSERAQKAIVDGRQRSGKYTDMCGFLQRTRIEEADTERLIYAGACDCFERQRNRSRLFWTMRGFFRKSKNMKVPELRPFSTDALLRFEYRMLGFLTRCHPVTQVNTKKKIKTVKIGILEDM